MARQNATNFTGSLRFPYATASTDPFLKEDLQVLAQAVDQHDHTTGKGLGVSTAIADGSITSAKIADGTIQSGDMAAGSAAANVGTLGGVLTGTLPSPGLATGSVTSTVIADGTIVAGDLASGAAASNVGALGGALTGTLPNPSLAALPANSVGASQITDLSVGTAELADGAVTSAKIFDGTIATGDLANSAVTNAKLGTDTARANLLTNGGFEIWQRGNGPFTTNAAYTADRWLNVISGTSTMSTVRDSTNQDTGSQYCAAVTYVHNATSYQQQYIDSFSQLRGRTVTLSMRTRTSTANAVRVSLDTTGTGSASVQSAYHTGGGAYETLSVSLSVAAGATGVYVGLRFDTSCTAYIDNAMLVVGSVAADYAPLHPADDLARCLRYYETAHDGVTVNISYIGYMVAPNSLSYYVPYRVKKAVTATVTKLGTWNVTNCAQPVAGSPDTLAYSLSAQASTTGVVAFSNAGVRGPAITIEANP